MAYSAMAVPTIAAGWAATRWSLGEVFPWFDACLTVSPLETEMFQKIAPSAMAVEIPTGGGVPLDRFPPRLYRD